MPANETATPIPTEMELVRLRRLVQERTRERDALAERAGRYEAFFHQAALGLLSLDAEGRVLDANANARALLGGEAAALVGQPFRDRLRPEDTAWLLAVTGAAGEGPAPCREIPLRRADGTWLTAEVTACRHDAVAGRTQLMFHDITARKAAELQAADQLILLRVLVDALPTPVFYKGIDGRYLGCNQAFGNFLGKPFRDIVGRTVDEVYGPEEAAVFRNMDRRLQADGGCQIYETRMTGREGLRQVICSKARYDDAQGRPRGLVGVITDITSRQEAETSRLRALEAAEAASRAKSSFLATMSHEIRTPLNGIMGMLQLVMTTAPTPEQSDYVHTALEAAEALLRILSDVLDISRIESGHLTLAEDVFDLTEVIRPVASSFAHEAASRGLSFVWGVAPGTPRRLQGDAGRLRQILYNLTANAIKYTRSGQVRLEIKALAQESDANAVALHFTVADTGIGIPSDQMNRVFDAFTQVDPSMTRPYGGSGLGLAIVRGLVDRLGGRVYLCSQEGQGTEVHVTLRFGRVALPAADRVAPETPPRLAGLRVLVVEDEKINQITAKAMLRKLGCQTGLAANGQAALAALAAADYDCVLMDVQMPVMDGLETARRLRAGLDGVRDPSVPVIALTAHAMAGDREAILKTGMDDYIAKPVDMDELARILAEVLAAKGRWRPGVPPAGSAGE